MTETTKTTHTIGPWKVTESCGGDGWALVVNSRGDVVANVNCESGLNLWPLVSTKMPTQANAHLIAAAPDLLAACKAILPYIAADQDDMDDSPYQTAIAAVSAAIAKAEAANA